MLEPKLLSQYRNGSHLSAQICAVGPNPNWAWGLLMFYFCNALWCYYYNWRVDIFGAELKIYSFSVNNNATSQMKFPFGQRWYMQTFLGSMCNCLEKFKCFCFGDFWCSGRLKKGKQLLNRLVGEFFWVGWNWLDEMLDIANIKTSLKDFIFEPLQ